MSAFDDIADDGMRTPHVTTLPVRDDAANSGRAISHKCDELLRLAHDILPGVQPAPHFFALFQDILADAQGRDQLLSSDLAAAQHLADVAQQVLDVPNLLENFRRCVLYLLVRLSARHSVFPRSLFIHGTQLGPNRRPVAGGRFADIYRGSQGTQDVAIKHARVYGNAESARFRKMLHKEAIVWRQLRHPHVLPLLGLDQSLFSDLTCRICMVSAWMENGALCHFVRSESYTVENDCVRFMSEIASGLAYLHSHKVVHGDLHGANVLIDKDQHAKLADFGLCIIGEATAGNPTQSVSSKEAGHFCYSAPEKFNPELLGNGRRAAVDVYAFACMCILLLTSRHPFQEMFEKTPYAVMFAVSQGQRPPRPEHSDCLLGPTDDMWILIKDCWQQEPGARPEMNTVHQRLQSVLNQGRDIQDKCDELLKLAHSVPPEVEISSHFIALLQDIWSDVRGRDCLLHADRAAAERLMEVAQRLLDTRSGPGDFRRGVLCMLIKLSILNSLIPASLFVVGTQVHVSAAMAGGRFADIFKGVLGAQKVAIKRMRVFCQAESARCRNMIHKEAIVWRQLQHPHVLPLLGLYTSIFEDSSICMVSPWIENGTLNDFVKSESYFANDCFRLMTELASGLMYLHSQNIVHRDLHGDNILIDDDHHIKLAGFNLCAVGEAAIDMVDQAALDMETGHICYMAPERFNPETQASCWQTAIDVYAFACLCILVLTSRHPFQELYERSQYEVMFAVTRGSRPARPKYPECLFEPTEDVWTLIQHCWHQEPGDRPGMISVHQRLQRVSVHKTPCLRPKGHPDRASSCADLAISLFTSFEQHGDVTLLDEALDLQREALHLRPEEHPDHASSCASLATLLFTRFHRTKDMTLLDEALDLQRQALRLRPEGHPARASSCAGLATALFAGFEHTRNMALLDEAIKLQREVLNIRLEGHPDHAVSCNNLVTSLLSQFSTTKNPDLVEEALELTRKV